jgi:hypothetical protein
MHVVRIRVLVSVVRAQCLLFPANVLTFMLASVQYTDYQDFYWYMYTGTPICLHACSRAQTPG